MAAPQHHIDRVQGICASMRTLIERVEAQFPTLARDEHLTEAACDAFEKNILNTMERYVDELRNQLAEIWEEQLWADGHEGDERMRTVGYDPDFRFSAVNIFGWRNSMYTTPAGTLTFALYVDGWWVRWTSARLDPPETLQGADILTACRFANDRLGALP